MIPTSTPYSFTALERGSLSLFISLSVKSWRRTPRYYHSSGCDGEDWGAPLAAPSLLRGSGSAAACRPPATTLATITLPIMAIIGAVNVLHQRLKTPTNRIKMGREVDGYERSKKESRNHVCWSDDVCTRPVVELSLARDSQDAGRQ